LKLYTIGFTQTTAETFFGRLRSAGIVTIIDTRIHRDGQLSGFAKVPDLPYFLERLEGIAYQAFASLAPSPAMLKSYRDKLVSWDEYAELYRQLLRERQPEKEIQLVALDRACLLCSEHTPERCHRRLAAEYLREKLASQADVEIIHL
jgi:uncharacterized protein (DUF488 family)